jgi:hypothetical protein
LTINRAPAVCLFGYINKKATEANDGMAKIKRHLITGTYAEQSTSFSMQRFKCSRSSSRSGEASLNSWKNTDGAMELNRKGRSLCLYGQVPVWLSADEMGQCLIDLEVIRSPWLRHQIET